MSAAPTANQAAPAEHASLAPPLAGAQSQPASDRSRFLWLLIGVTLLPYLLFPFSRHIVPDNAGLNGAVAVLLFLGAGGHVAASFFFYTDPEMRGFMREGRRGRFVIAPLLLVTFSTLLFVLSPPIVHVYALVAFWIWQVHHFSRQNQGILAFASRADGVNVVMFERLAVTLTGVAAILATVIFVTPFQSTWMGAYEWQVYMIALGVFGCAWVFYLLTLRLERFRQSPMREFVRFALMAFYAPLFLFRDVFSAVFIYLVAHGLQYLVFLHFIIQVPTKVRRRNYLVLLAFTLLGGAAIELARRPGGIDPAIAAGLLGASLGVVMWHFVLDAGVWRLSEAFPRKYMGQRFGFLRPPPRPTASP